MESNVFQLLQYPHDLSLSVFFPPSSFVHKHTLYHQRSTKKTTTTKLQYEYSYLAIAVGEPISRI